MKYWEKPRYHSDTDDKIVLASNKGVCGDMEISYRHGSFSFQIIENAFEDDCHWCSVSMDPDESIEALEEVISWIKEKAK